LAVGEAISDEVEDLAFLVGEGVEGVLLLAFAADAVHECGGGAGVEE
jgi:hypothetical protein